MSEIEKLKENLKITEKALNHVLNSALHPDIAIRALMVDLRPVREALELINKTNSQYMKSHSEDYNRGYTDTKKAFDNWRESLGYAKPLFAIKLRSAAENHASAEYLNGVNKCLHDLGYD